MNLQLKTQLEQKCREIRRMTIECIGSLGVGHVGGSLSITEALVVLYYSVMNIDPQNPGMEGRDRFILSKGHAGPALYCVLADKGYFDSKHLATLNRPETILPSHCDMNSTPGIDMSTGSLGQGFSCAVGIALGSKLQGDNASIYTIIGDGESQEGQIWEAAMFAGAQKLNNLIAFTDYNKMQLDGMVEDIVGLKPLADKWRSFRWNVIDCKDGNDLTQVYDAIMLAKKCKDKPSMILLNTIKGNGVSFAVNAGTGNHSMQVTKEMIEQARRELT
jgi:transketolase